MVKFKGFNNVGSSILGYKLVPVVDTGAKFAIGINMKTNDYNTEIKNDYNCDKKLRKVTYRKFLKTANKE